MGDFVLFLMVFTTETEMVYDHKGNWYCEASSSGGFRTLQVSVQSL